MGWLVCWKCRSAKEKITELDYSRCGVTDIPCEVYSCSPTLEVLHIEGNKMKELSPQLFQCIDLRYLNVSDNEIRAIPPLISKLTNLQVLIFSKNALTLDGLSQNMDRLTKLTTLDLSMNDFGKVPEVVLSLINLQQLCLNDTGIEFVPASIGRLSNLKVLELRDNNLVELPKSFRRLINLQRLDVSDNNLTSLYEVCESHGNLTELWINGNRITKLPSSISHLKKINDFDASCNELTALPKEIGYWTKITNLILSFNNLIALPKAIGNLKNLQVLKVESNFLEELPGTISKLTNLEEFNLQSNMLLELPPGIGHLRKLTTLILSENRIRYLPPEIGSCCALTILNIHHNRLEKLPDEIGHLVKLTTLGLIGNNLSCLPITLSKLTNLRALWLTPNQTQPLIHLHNEQFPNGQRALTSIVFPQTPLSEEPPLSRLHTVISDQNSHITFNMDNIVPHVSLNRTPTPHHKELKRLKNIIRDYERTETHTPSISRIKQARVAYISGDSTNSQILSEPETLNLTPKMRDTSSISSNSTIMRTNDYTPSMMNGLPKQPPQPPPYHIAAVYSKNAHLYQHSNPPSPHDQPKRFSQEQPLNIHMPTPKLALYKGDSDPDRIRYQDIDVNVDINEVAHRHAEEVQNVQINSEGQQKWPFGQYQMTKVMEFDLGTVGNGHNYSEQDFQIQWREDGVFISEVNQRGRAYGKLKVNDKVLRINDSDFTCVDSATAYEYAKRCLDVRTVTISRRNNDLK